MVFLRRAISHQLSAGMAYPILAREYFQRPTLQVARSLLGKYLIRDGKTSRLAGRIVEVEAYIGPRDRASHASRGRTKRTEVMFGPAGIAYVYLIYGMYHCFNVVTEREGYPAAILIRAVELTGDVLTLMGVGGVGHQPGGCAGPSPTLIDGPGRVCCSLEINLALNRTDLTGGRALWIEDRGGRVPRARIAAYPRIGVDYAGVWASKPWRFRLKRAKSE